MQNDCALLEKISRFFQIVCNKTIMGIFLFSLVSFCICVGVYSLRYPDIFRFYEIGWSVVSILLCILIVKLGLFLSKKSEKILIISMVLLTIFISFILNVSYQTNPVSDYAAIWRTANVIADGNLPLLNDSSSYVSVYSWQFGVSFFEGLLIQIFGVHFSVLKVLNTVLVCFINYLIYYSCKKKIDYESAGIAYVLSTLFMSYFLTLPQLTNHHLTLPLLLISLNLFECDKKKMWLLCGILVAILNFIRPYGVITVLTVLCYSMYQILKTKSLKKYFLLFISFIIPYVVVQKTFDFYFVEQGYVSKPVSESSIPYFKFQKGLYGYNEPFNDLKSYNYDYSAYNNAMKQELIEKIKSQPKEMSLFVLNKMVRYLGLFDYQFEMTFNQDTKFYYRYPIRAFYCISWFQYIVCLIAGLLGFMKCFDKEKMDVWKIFFVGNTLVYIFIEAFSSYRFESYPFLIICASVGLSRLKNENRIRKQVVYET